MKRSAATPSPTYEFTFHPLMDELRMLNSNYATLIEEANRHEMNQAYHEKKWDRQIYFDVQSNRSLQMEFEALQLQKKKIQNDEILITDQISVIVAKAFALFPELIAELQYDDSNLSEARFKIDFLSKYKDVIENSNKLPCYSANPHFNEIVASINKHFNESKN